MTIGERGSPNADRRARSALGDPVREVKPMFRPRLPRRPVIRPAVARRVHPALRALRQANRLMEEGQYAQAYPIFRRLAEGADEQGMPIQAANLYLQAARARIEMGSATDAVTLARRAVQLLIGAGRRQRVSMLLPGLVERLEDKGHHQQAVDLRAEVVALLGTTQVAPVPVRRGILPARCPSCGAPARPDEVTWIDDRTAECCYCGSVIQAE